MLNMACKLFKLTPTEALSGITCNAVKALGIDNTTGKLEECLRADIAIWDIEYPSELPSQFGVNYLLSLYKEEELIR